MGKKEIKIVYCPTDKMIADYNSKPLQGKLFIDMRDQMMGINIEDYPMYKDNYKAILEQYDLFDAIEDDLYQL